MSIRIGARRGVVAVSLAGLALAAVGGCSGASVAGDETGLEPLVGEWRGVLLAQGGELPFHFRVNAEGESPPAVVINAGVEQSLVAVTRQGAASYTLQFFHDRESEIVAKMSPDGQELSGYWRSEYGGGADDDRGLEPVTQMPFFATKNSRRRFQRNDPTLDVAPPDAIAALPDINGEWEVRVVTDESGAVAVGTIVQQDEHVVADVISRDMEGIYRNGLLRLSMFDGFRPLLLHARARPDGRLEGRLWIGDQGGADVTVGRALPGR